MGRLSQQEAAEHDAAEVSRGHVSDTREISLAFLDEILDQPSYRCRSDSVIVVCYSGG